MLNNLLAASAVLKNIGYVAIAVLILLIMITVHEAGHYFVGKLFKFKINEFAIGMGPALFKRKLKSGEFFSVRALPLGGFCAFDGEDDDKEDENSFNRKKPWQRILVLLAGATMNYLLALVVIAITFGVYGQQVIGVSHVNDGVKTEQSLSDGDYIEWVKVNGKKTSVYITTDLTQALKDVKAGQTVEIGVLRKDGKYARATSEVRKVVLREDLKLANMTEVNKVYDALGFGSALTMKVENGVTSPFKNGDILLRIGDTDDRDSATFIDDETDFFNALKDKAANTSVYFFIAGENSPTAIPVALGEEWQNADKSSTEAIAAYFGVTFGEKEYYVNAAYAKFGFFKTLGHSFVYSFKIAGTVFTSLGQLITGKIGIRAVGGTITTIKTASQLISYGWFFALQITALIGVNLAVFNLLPIPALDGARIVFCLIEWIFKKPVNRKVEGAIHAIGLLLLLGFAILVDVLQFI